MHRTRTPSSTTRPAGRLEKVAPLKADLAAWAPDISARHLANSLGAEDMVLTDLIATGQLPIEIFSLDTGRLPLETYDLMARVQQHYGLKLKFYYPRHEPSEAFTREHGINAFYDGVETAQGLLPCPQGRTAGPRAGRQKAWITGLRAQQSTTRTDLPGARFDAGNGLVKFNPLADWTERKSGPTSGRTRCRTTLARQVLPKHRLRPCTRPPPAKTSAPGAGGGRTRIQGMRPARQSDAARSPNTRNQCRRSPNKP